MKVNLYLKNVDRYKKMLKYISPYQNSNKETSISLKSLKLDINIENHLTTLTVDQDFFNSGSEPLECEYTFPILKKSVVVALNILLPDGSVLNSRIEEEEKALETYQDALSQGHAAALGRSENPESMVVQIGNILPSESVKIQIILACPISAELNSWNFVVPTEFMPNLSDVNNQAYPIEVRINVLSIGAISDYSSTWNLAWHLSENKLSLAGFAVLAIILNEPLSITYKSSNTYTPTCITQQKGDKYAAMISFIPLNNDGKDSEYLEGTGEYIFLLDRSGSMDNERIKIAIHAALLFLKSLPLTSKFNIISFGTGVVKMFSNSKIASTENIDSALSLLKPMKADMGGTNILNALTIAFENHADNKYPRNIFLLTDGGDDHSKESLQLIKENKSTCRIHGFGIQSSESEAKFLSDVSKLGKGRAFFINKIEELGRSVIKALSKCVMPCMNQWEINWTGRAVPTSTNIGSVYYGEVFTQYVLMGSLPESLPTIKYFDTYSKIDVEINIQRAEPVQGEAVFKLWAKNQIAEFSLSQDQNSREIIEISKEYQVASSLTAFVCVKTQEREVEGDLKTIKISSRSTLSCLPPPNFSQLPRWGCKIMVAPKRNLINKPSQNLPLPGASCAPTYKLPVPIQNECPNANSIPHYIPFSPMIPAPSCVIPPSINSATNNLNPRMNQRIILRPQQLRSYNVPPPGLMMPPPPCSYNAPPQGLMMPPPLCPSNVPPPTLMMPPPSFSYNVAPPGLMMPPSLIGMPYMESSKPNNNPINSFLKGDNPVLAAQNPPYLNSTEIGGLPTMEMNPGIGRRFELPVPPHNFLPQNLSMSQDRYTANCPPENTHMPDPYDHKVLYSAETESKSPGAPNLQKSNLAKKKSDNSYIEIVTKIKSEGFWEYNEVEPLFEELKEYRREISDMEDNVVATMFLLCYLAANYAEKVDEWILLKRKSINWLMKVGIVFETSKVFFNIT